MCERVEFYRRNTNKNKTSTTPANYSVNHKCIGAVERVAQAQVQAEEVPGSKSYEKHHFRSCAQLSKRSSRP